MRRSHRPASAIVALLAFATLAAISPPGAAAISDDEELTTFGSTGSGAGELRAPSAVASDPVTGHVFIFDGAVNHRISEFTPWGNFVKAFGWDVAPGAVNEQQEVRVRAAEGQFKLSFGASPPTSDLAFNAPGSESQGPGSVEAALNALPSIGGAGGEVSVKAVPGTPDGKTPFIYVIAFKGSLAGTDVDQIAVENGTTPLAGGVPTSTFEARTRADGTAGGTGLESCTAESTCQAGLAGDGAGQSAGAYAGLAVDGAGNLYVKESGNLRVQKFDPAGRFLLMFGAEVNKTKVDAAAPESEQNICPVDPGDVCQEGVSGTGDGEFSSGGHEGIDVGSGGQIFAADDERIQRFDSQGEFQAAIPVVGEGVGSLAFDPVSGALYATFLGSGKSGVHKLDSTTGADIAQLAGQGNVATDPVGNVFANGPGDGGESERKIVQYDSSGKPLSPPNCCAVLPFDSGFGTNGAGDLYIPNYQGFVRVFGPAPVIFEAAPQVPPTISAQYATSVGRTDATVAAEINPHFWSNTRSYLQYGTGKCSEGGCEETKPLPPGPLLTSKVTSAPVQSAGILLNDLEPGTTYHFRFLAESGGGSTIGEEGSFTTYPAASQPKIDCQNQAFRIGFSAPLPDCRAYEMVSPVDKNSGDIFSLLAFNSYNTNHSRSAVDGDSFTYTSYRAFADPKSALYVNQYMANRDPDGGWSSESLNPAAVTRLRGLPTFDNPYKLFSDDLCTSWLITEAEPVLDPRAAPNSFIPYRRESCGAESYEALIQDESTLAERPIALQGVSADGEKAIIEYNGDPDDDLGTSYQTFYTSEGERRLVCIGTDGSPDDSCAAGTGPELQDNDSRELFSTVRHAISEDGSRVYWTDAGAGPGQVYLRVNPGQEQSELSGTECTEAEKACTLEVSEAVTSKASRFWAASADGSKALFEVTDGAQGGNLYLFDVEEPASPRLIAGGSMGTSGGVAAASDDLSHVYFVSKAVLPETSGATAGKPNLYLDQGGTKTFIATISVEDAKTNAISLSIYHAAQATADGSHLVFVSDRSLTGYDNTEQASRNAAMEVYLYETGGPGPVCISCNPSGARPLGRMFEANANMRFRQTASWLAYPENALYAPRVISSNGKRVFFNSFDALLPRDTNGKGDVYEWQAASDAEECKEKGADLYVQSSGGCLSLISSGQSPSDSQFLDANPSGSDVFFTTLSSLLPQDPGLIDVYDAREGGGLPAPPEPPGRCQGEACQIAPPPPNDPTPASASFRGAANPKPAPRCRKGKVTRRGRCVAKKRKKTRKQQSKRSANHDRRQSR